jgi:hypothetical protein
VVAGDLGSIERASAHAALGHHDLDAAADERGTQRIVIMAEPGHP